MEFESKFDLVFSFNYLEHQPDTKEFIEHINRLTTDNAFVYITVPNLDFLLGAHCLYEFVADHLVYFTRETLVRAFELNGFNVLESQYINNNNDILLIAKKRSPLRLESFQHEVSTLCNNLNKLVSNYKQQGKKIAVWGGRTQNTCTIIVK